MGNELSALNRISRKTITDIEDGLINLLGSSYKQYREEWVKSSTDKSYNLDFPLHLDLELNDFCNQACIMCPRNTVVHNALPYEINTKVSVSTDNLKKVISDSVPRGLKSVNFGAFAEPLIHKGLWDFIAYCHEVGIIDTRVITNGLLLDKYVEEIFSSGLINLFVSLDGHSEETYGKIRGKGYNKIKTNLLALIDEKKIRKSSLPVIRVSWVDMEINRHEKDDFINFWIDKVDHVDIQTWSDYSKKASHSDLVEPKKFECRSPWQRLSILADGSILPCCDFNGRSIPIGNLSINTLPDVWDGQELLNIRSGIQNDDSPICSACQRCLGT